MKPYLEASLDPEPRWLSATIPLYVWGASAAGNDQLASRLAGELGRTMPAAHIERDGSWMGLDLRLTDPADQDARIEAWLSLCAIAIGLGLEARLLGMLGWILKPAMASVPDWVSALADRSAYEARDFGLRNAAAPLINAIAVAPREHGMAGSIKGFAAFHRELTPVERYLVRIFGRSPKNGGRRENIGGRRSPFAEAELALVATSLATRGWIKDLGPNQWGGDLSAHRGKLLSGLSPKELLPA
jgi:hypothetical protein